MYYQVLDELRIPKHVTQHDFGFEDYNDFFVALRKQHELFAGRIGAVADQRDDRVCLLLCDERGLPTKQREWFPRWMLKRTVQPVEDDEDSDPIEELLDKVYGFE